MKPGIQFSLFLIFCLLSLNTFAATVTWTGNDGEWEDPANWDTNSVPTIGDDVIIPDGEVEVNTAVLIQSLIVESTATLIVGAAADLAIDPNNSSLVFSLDVAGKMAVYGTVRRGGTVTTLASLRVTVSGYWTTYPSGELNIELGYLQVETPSAIVYNRGTLTVENNSFAIRAYGVLYNRGVINCQGINASFDGIRIFSAGQWVNYGTVNIAGYNTGVDNENRWYNRGQVTIDGADNGIKNEGRIDNASTGSIQILNGGNWDMIDNSSTGRIRNWGSINVDAADSFYGINNDGRIDNYGSASMTFDGDYVFTVIKNWDSGEIYNYGNITFGNTNLDTNYGLENNGGFINYDDGELSFWGSYDIYCLSNRGDFTNYGYCDFDEEVRNLGTLVHTDCGEMKIAGGIVNITSNYWLNESILRLDGVGGFDNLSGQFINTSVIEDRYNVVNPTDLDNQGIIAKRQNSLYTGTTTNFMELGTPGLVVLHYQVYDAVEGNPVGEYDFESNKLGLENSALGLTELYFVDQNCEFWFVVEIPTGIQAPPSPFSGGDTWSTDRTLDLKVYPNPTINYVQLEMLATTAEEPHHWSIHNQLGQLLLQGETRTNESISIDLTTIPAGAYFLRLQDVQGAIVFNEQIIKQ